MIPSGELLYELFLRETKKIYRDSYHASLGVTRYALALLWLRVLTGVSVRGNSFSSFDEAVSDEEKETVFDAVEAVFP